MEGKFWQNRNVLVTGGTGLLGAELIFQLLDLGADVAVIIRDRVSQSRLFLEEMYRKVSLAHGDVTDFEFVERVVGEYEVDTVFHVAAQTQVRIGNASPLSTFNSNIKGTWNVLEACRLHQNRIRSVIVASSDKAYGDQEILPYEEEAPLLGRHPYDVSKSCTDLLSQGYWHTYQLPVSITRCGNLFGPGDLNFDRLIPGTILSLLNNQPPVIRSDGQYVRNYFYVKDAANGYLAISQQMDKAAGQAFNIGPAEYYSVIEITRLIIKLMGSNLEPVIKNEATNEIREQYLSVEKVKSVLGWQTRFTTEEALKETIDWYRKYFSLS